CLREYRDLAPDFADACLIQLADELDTGDILTLDGDFRCNMSLQMGQVIKTINADSGQVVFFRVTGIYGRSFFARKIRESEASQDAASIVVRPGPYGRQA